MADARVQVVDHKAVIQITGNDLLIPLVIATEANRTASEDAAARAAVSSATAESASGPTYASTTAGLAATTNGQSFAADNGDGTVTVYLNDDGSAVSQRTLATTEALASPTGASLIKTADGGTVQGAIDVGGWFRQAEDGAEKRTSQDARRDFVSVKDYGAVGDAQTNTTTGVVSGTDDTDAFLAALATGKNVFVPVGNYRISSPLQIKFNGQTLFGQGTYTTTLVWTGSEESKGVIELWTGRRDAVNSAGNYTNQRVTGFRITSGTDSVCYAVIWVEAGIFHSEISNIRILNIFGTITGAAVKLDSNSGDSYPVGFMARDIVITGIANGKNTPIPIGVWIESAIEAKFDRVKVYSTGDGWVVGSSGAFDNVENCKFIDCHSEIGDRGYGDDTGSAIRLYCGSNLTFVASKYTCGINDQAGMTDVTDQTTIEFSSPDQTKPFRNIVFLGCNIWQVSNPVIQARMPVVFNTDAVGRDILFQGCRVNAVNGFISNLADISLDQTNTSYEAVIPAIPNVSFAGRSGVSATPASMDAAGVQTIAAPAEYSPFGLPVQVSSDASLSGVRLDWYKTTKTGLNVFSLWNPNDASTVAFGMARRFSKRHYQPNEIASRVSKNWDPSSYAVNTSQTTTIPCPGVHLGDFVRAGFVAPASGGMGSHLIHAWVSDTGIVSVELFNPVSTKNFGSGLLTVFHLSPNFDYIASATYDPASLDTLTTASKAVAVAGAQIGDFVEVSFSLDSQGVIMWGEVTAAGTVTVYLFNATSAAIDLASETLIVGVRTRNLSL